jgi:hypothetical protein
VTLITQVRPIAISAASDFETGILQQYAEFWKIPYRARVETSGLPTFTTGHPLPRENSTSVPTVITPSTEDAERVARDNRLELTRRRLLLKLPVNRDTEVSIEADVHEFSGANAEPILLSGKVPLLVRVRGTSTYLLSLDLIREYSTRVYQGFEESPNWKFRLASRLPLSYQTIPRFVRDRAFRSTESVDLLSHERLGPVEFLRTLFLASIVRSSGPIPRIGFWKRGKSYALAVTHDVETEHGLETGAGQLLGVEREVGLRSTWNLPSDRYPLSSSSVQQLSYWGEIGGHDTRHDGRLVLLEKRAKLQRLKECRETLERLSMKPVRGFRAPLLQHSSELARAEAESGYEYDSSCPSWEILSPTSMRPHGVGTVFPFEMNGVLEIPVSLPQDHQLIRVAGQTPADAVDLLLSLSTWVRGLGGPCVLLVHPDYELADAGSLSEYRRLLEGFASDPACQTMTLGEMADWWKHRASAHWDLVRERPRVISDGLQEGLDLQLELVTAHEEDGFRTEALS